MLHEEKWVCQRCRAVGELDIALDSSSGNVDIVSICCSRCGSEDVSFGGTSEQYAAFRAAVTADAV